jgi:hypothetical protein
MKSGKMKLALFAVKPLWVLVLFVSFTGSVWAGAAAVVQNIYGTASVQRADGSLGILALKSELYAGDSVQTEDRSKLLLRFSDGAMVTVRSNSRLMIEGYHYEEENPQADNTTLNLLKGGMRAISGAVGKRGDKDAYRSKNFAATIGIRGTGYIVRSCVAEGGGGVNDGQILRVPADKINAMGYPVDGLYFTVTDGVIVLINATGEYRFMVGQSGYVRDFESVPEELKDDPGLQLDYLESLSGLGGTRRFVASPEFCMVR